MLHRIKTIIKTLVFQIVPPFMIKLIKGLKPKQKQELKGPFETTIFRNDDVSFDTNLKHFKEFCEVFHKHGYVQLHAVTLYGCCNDKYVIDGIPCMYDTIKPLDIYDYESCKKVSTDYIGDNKALIEYLNTIPDEIGLHGLIHSNYSAMSYEKQEHDIKEGLRLLHELFPNKNITTFIAPFNMTNDYTYEICKKYGLRVSALEGEHLEDMIHNNRGGIQFGQLYRYHHHRFYPESTQDFYDLSIDKLDKFLGEKSSTKIDWGGVDPCLVKVCVYANKAQKWYVYNHTEFYNRKHAYYVYDWACKNLNKSSKILEIACGAGGVLYYLYAKGFVNLTGYDYDINAVNSAKEISATKGYNIHYYQDDATSPHEMEMYDFIYWVNGMYHVDGYNLEKYFNINCKFLNNNGIIAFDMVDKSFNKKLGNEYCSQDLNKPVSERRPSEYKVRYNKKEVVKIAKSYGLQLIKYYPLLKDAIPRCVYVFRKAK